MVCCLVICPLCLCACCTAWCFRRALLTGEQQSHGWPDATIEECEDFPRLSRLMLAAYEDNLSKPSRDLPEEDRLQLREEYVLKRVGYDEAKGRFPPYMIYLDHDARDICLAVRGLNLAKASDYFVLLNNQKGKQKFGGGFVHCGLLKAAGCLLDEEMDNLARLLRRHPTYTLTLVGHSLGAGIVALMAIVLCQNLDSLDINGSGRGETGDEEGSSEGKGGGVRSVDPRHRIRAVCFAPPRCTSLTLALRHADIVNSIVLQDDFLPRMGFPLATIFGAWLCLPCLLCWACCVDNFVPDKIFSTDPKRLYPPGRLYHILYTDSGSCRVHEHPPTVRTAIDVDRRFEKIVLSATVYKDHLLTNMNRILKDALEVMAEKDKTWASAPPRQRMQRQQTMRSDRHDELVAAMERAASLGIPNAPLEDEILRVASLRPDLDVHSRESSGGGAHSSPQLLANHTEQEKEGDDRGATAEKEFPKSDSAKRKDIEGKWSRLIDGVLENENEDGSREHHAREAGRDSEREAEEGRNGGEGAQGWGAVRSAMRHGALA